MRIDAMLQKEREEYVNFLLDNAKKTLTNDDINQYLKSKFKRGMGNSTINKIRSLRELAKLAKAEAAKAPDTKIEEELTTALRAALKPLIPLLNRHRVTLVQAGVNGQQLTANFMYLPTEKGVTFTVT